MYVMNPVSKISAAYLSGFTEICSDYSFAFCKLISKNFLLHGNNEKKAKKQIYFFKLTYYGHFVAHDQIN